jgi:hypothetical protein
MKSLSAFLLLAVMVGIVPAAKAATTIEVTIVGASAEWQTLALAAYSLAGAGAGHWTSASNVVSVTDTRGRGAGQIGKLALVALGDEYERGRSDFHNGKGRNGRAADRIFTLDIERKYVGCRRASRVAALDRRSWLSPPFPIMCRS